MDIRRLQFRHRILSLGRCVCAMGILFLLLIAAEHPASAYTDPGTGTMMYQLLAAGFLGMGFYARKVVRWFRMKGKG